MLLLDEPSKDWREIRAGIVGVLKVSSEKASQLCDRAELAHALAVRGPPPRHEQGRDLSRKLRGDRRKNECRPSQQDRDLETIFRDRNGAMRLNLELVERESTGTFALQIGKTANQIIIT